ncbi:hypothetical protein OROMI_006419 [Orobanche minor]
MAPKMSACNPELIPGIRKISRSAMYHKRGLWAIEEEHGGKFPVHKKAAAAAMVVDKPPKFYLADDIKKPLSNKRKPRPTKLRYVSPEASKSLSVKRFKFSPGMLIKQSQDENDNEVTWKISPINEKLLAISKNLPNRIRVLADTTSFNSRIFQPCSQKKVQTSPRISGKLEKWLSSPSLKADKKYLTCYEGQASRKINPSHDSNCHRNNRYIKESKTVV